MARGHLQIHVASDARGRRGLGSEPAAAGRVPARLPEAAIEAFELAGQEPDLNAALRLPGMLSAGADAGAERRSGRKPCWKAAAKRWRR